MKNKAAPEEKNEPLVKPFLKWAGGKRRLLPEITRLLPENFDKLRYYEPFLGAGALFLHCRPQRAVLNDDNKELVAAYRAVRDDVEELIGLLRLHKEMDCEDYYYRIRELDRSPSEFQKLSGARRAARLIYLNKTCFNGLYRVNSRGFFNVPYGHYVSPAVCDEPGLRALHEYLAANRRGIKFMDGDFAEAVRGAGDGSFIYFDPPYHSPGNANFTSYQAGVFGEGEQRRLRAVFAERTGKGAKCLLSNSDTPFVRKLYEDKRFEIISVRAARAINSDGAGRGEVGEVIVRNWK